VIGYLKGHPIRVSAEKLLLDVGGVGYEVHVSTGTSLSAQQVASSGSPVELHIHTHLRDDALSLFGFWTEQERQLFELLITVSGIGPRLARTILSAPSLGELLAAIVGHDVARLQKTPGVGKKTAERIVLELSDKVKELAAQVPAGARATGPGEDVVSALVNLGYKPSEAEEAVRGARNDADGAEFHETLRLALKRLSRA